MSTCWNPRIEPKMEPLESWVQKYLQNLSKIQDEPFSVNTKLPLRGSVWTPIFANLKSTICQFSLKKIKTNNGIVVLGNFLTSCESTCCKKWIFGAPEPHFRDPKNQIALSLFWKFLLEHFIFRKKKEVFIQSMWFFIPDNIESVPNHILRKYKKRNLKRNSCIFSKFEHLEIWSKIW